MIKTDKTWPSRPWLFRVALLQLLAWRACFGLKDFFVEAPVFEKVVFCFSADKTQWKWNIQALSLRAALFKLLTWRLVRRCPCVLKLLASRASPLMPLCFKRSIFVRFYTQKQMKMRHASLILEGFPLQALGFEGLFVEALVSWSSWLRGLLLWGPCVWVGLFCLRL